MFMIAKARGPLPGLTLGLLGLGAMLPAFAHHSFAATYFEDKNITVEGTLVQFMFRNPHSFVHIEAPDDKGNMETWADRKSVV